MPIHDWTRVDAGTFHDFHQAWTIAIRNALNGGGLPRGYFAMAEQARGGPIPDVITLRARAQPGEDSTPGGVAISEQPPRTRYRHSAEPDLYAARANRIVIRHRRGVVVSVIEIVTLGNKASRNGLRTYVEKARNLLISGIRLLVIDLFPPGPRDSQGIHKAIWDEIRDEPFELPADKPLTLASYFSGEATTAYVEPVAVGDALPQMPIFLSADTYVPAPLEATYQATWEVSPESTRELLERPGETT